jgi:tRNA(Arg) A34 adenosine deaminase TadA
MEKGAVATTEHVWINAFLMTERKATKPNRNSRLLDHFETYGWNPNVDLSEDDNFMDLVLLITRSSNLKQGSMACILVEPQQGQNDNDPEQSNRISEEQLETPQQNTLTDRIIGVATNRSLYKPGESDIHAEIAAIGQAARLPWTSTEGCTAYITMPPCRRCFGALVCAGVGRIVSRHTPNSFLQCTAEKNGIELLGLENQREQRDRVDAIIHSYRESRPSL